MWTYQPPLDEIRFAIEDWLQADKEWAQVPEFAELDIETAGQILEEAGRFATNVLLPINLAGDSEGCHYDNGEVRTPAGYRQAYQSYVENGWPALSCASDCGGQGLPQILNAGLYEMLMATGHAWSMYPGLAHGAYECLRTHGSAALKQQYLPKLVSGEWLATMCLTEAHAGSDLGLLRTRAEPEADAGAEKSYRITGTKIFISGGQHDLTENIIHLVLARLPDAPVGTRGISLFLVPKLVPELTPGLAPDANGLRPNGVNCAGIEKKMGIKGSATCTLNFQDSTGWLIGEPHRGLAAMFVMMNAARLHVALQGLAHSEIAHQNALAYARERVQMRAARRVNPGTAADPIIAHPAIRRMLLEQRAITQAERFIGYWSAHLLDMAEYHPDVKRREYSAQLASLLIPVSKAMFTENGFALANSALQIYGGHGYIHENGIEQTLRDSRITMLYEGTTEIQAIDLVTRKIMGDKGAALQLLLAAMHAEAVACDTTPVCAQLGKRLQESLDLLQQATVTITSNASEDVERVLRGAVDYQRMLASVLFAYSLAKAARISVGKPAGSNQPSRMETARFYFDFLLPQARHHQQLLEVACAGLPGVE